MTATVAAAQRFTARQPCPICGGHDTLPPGHGVRCYGFLSSDSRYAHCTREEHAGGLEPEPDSDTYAHRLDGPCRCGVMHGDTPPPGEKVASNGHGPRPSVIRTRRWKTDCVNGEDIEHVRIDLSDGTKKLWWERGGRKGLGGHRVTDLPLYGIADVGDAKGVIVVEGEPARDALAPVAAALGLAVVGTVTGAGGDKRPNADVLRALPAVPIYLWPDSDVAGEAHMTAIATALVGMGRPRETIRRLIWPDARPGEGDDAADFVQRGGSPDALKQLDSPPFLPTASEAKPAAGSSGRVRFMTARQFAELTPATTEWVIEPWVPVGGTTKVDGPPKKAGKTTLITHMIAAVLDGADFLGRPTKQGPVILLSEQGGTSLREALAHAGLLQRDDLHLALYRDIAALAWPEVVAETMALAREIGAVLLVVDTLPACSGVRGDDENSSGRALEALEPIQIGADLHGLGVVVSFHDRKGGGEVGESGRGSTAYAGAVDIILHLTKPGGNFSPTIRKIEGLSRFEATPDELYIELTATGYVSLGSEDDVVSAAIARALVDVLPDTEDAAKRINNATEKDKETGEERIIERGLIDDLAGQGVKAARSTLDAELNRWVEAGYAGKSGAGKKGSPTRYWLVAKPPDSFFRYSHATHRKKESDAEAPQGADDGQMHSSDAPTPSEACMAPDEITGDDEAILSSDAPDGYIGRKHFAGDFEEIVL